MNSGPEIILITGTTRGIGEYLAQYYLKKGMTVIGCGRGLSSISHPNYYFFQIDVSSEVSVLEMFKSIHSDFGRLDILINNAAVNPRISMVALTPYQVAASVINTNFLGSFLISREASKLMIKNKYGRIINLSSMAVHHEVKGEALYTASKAAICSLSRVMAKELQQFGITCNVISPSAIDTEMSRGVDSEALRKILSINAINAPGKMADISQTIDFLINKSSDFVTGQNIYLGGV